MKRAINRRPMAGIAIMLAIGIACGFWTETKSVAWIAVAVAIIAIAAIVTSVIAMKNGDGRTELVYVLAGAIFLGIGFANSYLRVESFIGTEVPETTIEVRGRVEEVVRGEKSEKIVVGGVEIKGAYEREIIYKIEVTIKGEKDIEEGDRVRLVCRAEETGIEYDSKITTYYLARGIRFKATIEAEEIEITGKSPTIFEEANKRIREELKRDLPEREYATAYALLCGNSGIMESEQIEGYRYAGIAHLFAVSGLHIGFLYGIIKITIGRMRINKYVRSVIEIVILFMYSGICGFTASSLRAAIMASVMLVGKTTGKKYDGITAVGIAGIIIMTITPFELFETGFELSFVVVSGILMTSEYYAEKMKIIPRRIRRGLGTVISAQVFGIPICIMRFGWFSAIGLITNVIAIPIVGVVYTIVFVLTGVSMATGIGGVIMAPAEGILKVINTVVTAYDLKEFVIYGTGIGVYTITYYIAVIAGSPICIWNKRIKGIIAVILAAVTAAGVAVTGIKDRGVLKVRISGEEEISCVMLSVDGKNTMIVTESESKFRTNKIERMIKESGSEEIENLIITGGEVQAAVTKISGIAKVKKVYAEGEYFEIKATEKSFMGIEIKGMERIGEIEEAGLRIKEIGEGIGIRAEYGSKRITIISKTEGEEIEKIEREIKGKTDLIVSADRQERIKRIIGKEKYVSYMPYEGCIDAYSKGFLLYSFSK